MVFDQVRHRSGVKFVAVRGGIRGLERERREHKVTRVRRQCILSARRASQQAARRSSEPFATPHRGPPLNGLPGPGRGPPGGGPPSRV